MEYAIDSLESISHLQARGLQIVLAGLPLGHTLVKKRLITNKIYP